MIDEAYELVAQFQKSANQPVSSFPQQLKSERVAVRAKWIEEELEEFIAADSLYSQVDALADLLYYLLGAFVEIGIKPDAVFQIVHCSNMEKLSPPSGMITDSAGKIQKPPGWVHPDKKIAEAIDSLICKNSLSNDGGYVEKMQNVLSQNSDNKLN